MNYEQFAFVNHQLAGMLRDGIPLEGSLRQLCSQMQRGPLRSELQLLESDLAKGLPLATALTTRKLPAFYVQMLQIGARSNDLPAVLTLLADYYQTANHTWTRLKGLMVYPVLVLILSTVLSFWIAMLLGNFSASSHGPSLTNIFKLSTIVSGSPRPPTRPAVRVRPQNPGTAKSTATAPASNPTSGSAESNHWLPSLADSHLWLPPLVLAALATLAFFGASLPSLRRNLYWRLPAFKEASLARFASATAILLKSGCPLPDALSLLAQMERGTSAGKEVARWKNRCADGHAKFSAIAAGSKIFPPMFVWLVAGADEDLAIGFERAAQTYQARATYRTEVLLYAALPASLLLLGLMILSQIYPIAHLIFGLPNNFPF